MLDYTKQKGTELIFSLHDLSIYINGRIVSPYINIFLYVKLTDPSLSYKTILLPYHPDTALTELLLDTALTEPFLDTALTELLLAFRLSLASLAQALLQASSQADNMLSQYCSFWSGDMEPLCMKA